MTTPELPDALRAAARDLLFAVNTRFADPISEKYRADKLAETQLLADAALAGFLAACEVREEWGVRYTHEGLSHEVWRSVEYESGREETALAVAQRRAQNIPDHRVDQLRCVVITTPTEVKP